MDKIFVRGYLYGGTIPFDVIWKSEAGTGSFKLCKNQETGQFTFGQDPEDFYSNVSESIIEVLDRINDNISIISDTYLKDLSYYQNKKTVLSKMVDFLNSNEL